MTASRAAHRGSSTAPREVRHSTHPKSRRAPPEHVAGGVRRGTYRRGNRVPAPGASHSIRLMDPTPVDPSSIRPQAVGSLVEDGFMVLGRCYRSLLPLAAATSALGYLATWIIARSALVDGSFVEDRIVKAPAGSGAWAEYGSSVATIALLVVMYLVITAVLLPATIPAVAGYRITRVPWSSAARVVGPALAVGVLMRRDRRRSDSSCSCCPASGSWSATAWPKRCSSPRGIGGYAALRRSKSLVAGRWWATFGLLVVVSLMTGLVSLVPLRIAEAGVSSPETIILLDNLVGFLATTITAPYVAAVTAALYIDLRARKEPLAAESFADMVRMPDADAAPTFEKS